MWPVNTHSPQEKAALMVQQQLDNQDILIIVFFKPLVLHCSHQNYTDASEDDFVSIWTARRSNEHRGVDSVHHPSVFWLNDKPVSHWQHERQLWITNMPHFQTVVSIWKRSAVGGRGIPNGQMEEGVKVGWGGGGRKVLVLILNHPWKHSLPLRTHIVSPWFVVVVLLGSIWVISLLLFL